MRNDNLSLNNFKIKLYCQRLFLFFINEHDIGGSTIFFNFEH